MTSSLIKLDQATQMLAEIRTVLPRTPGIYFVYSGESLLYVGQARNIRKRLGGHHRKSQFNEVSDLRIEWENVSIEGLDRAERHYIKSLSPKWNGLKMPKKRKEYQDIPPNKIFEMMQKALSAFFEEPALDCLERMWAE